jgi:hypothetical protein
LAKKAGFQPIIDSWTMKDLKHYRQLYGFLSEGLTIIILLTFILNNA